MQQRVKLGLLLLAFSIGMFLVHRFNDRSVAPDGLVTSETRSKPTRTINILFVGDSYTFTNGMPDMVSSIASSDKGATMALALRFVAKDKTSLEELWSEKQVQDALKERHWDYVVLQEESAWAMEKEQVAKTYAAAARFAAVIQKAGGMPVLFLTWMRKPGSPWYQSPYAELLHTPKFMRESLAYYTAYLGGVLHAPVIPVGDAWAAAIKGHPMLQLYAADGSNPSVTGSYFTALMFYHYLGHRPVDQVGYAPMDINAGDIAYLKSVVMAYKVN